MLTICKGWLPLILYLPLTLSHSFEKSHDDIKAFPLGMSMVSGDGATRVVPESGVKANLDPSKGPVNAARWTCPRLNGNYNPPSWPADSDGSMAGIGDPVNKGEGIGFPDQNCDGYASPLRADVHFPSCYNPKAGLTNYAENMAWPEDNKGYLDCPEGYIHVPHLFLEVYWNTPEFADRWEQGKGQQPFVLSSGDATGFSSHGDFMSGWDEELLQHIIDTCNTGTIGMDKCPGLFYGLNKEECTIDSLIDEKIDGVLDKLPGNNPLQGWSYGVTGGSSPPPSSGEGDKSEPASIAPAATSKAVEDESTTKTPARETTTKASLDEETTAVAAADASTESKITTATAKSATYGGNRPAFTVTPFDDVPKATAAMTGVFGKLPPSESAKSSTCKRKTHTVYETVTVTQTVPESPVETAAREDIAKREQLRRHVHDHAHAHRRRSHHH